LEASVGFRNWSCQSSAGSITLLFIFFWCMLGLTCIHPLMYCVSLQHHH